MTNSTSPRLCPACGSTLSAGVKFCESCGTPVPQAPAFCTQCGVPLSPCARFCGNCGAPLSSTPGAATPPAPAARAPYTPPLPARPPAAVQAPPRTPPPAEPILAVVPTLSLRKGMLSFLEYNLVVTPHRLVFARVTQKMIGDAAMEAKQAVRGQGKGFMHQWAAVAGARQYLCERYRQMSIESILALDAESFFFPLQQVREIHTGSDSDDDTSTDWLQVQTTSSKMRFTMQGGGAESARRALKPLLGDLVR